MSDPRRGFVCGFYGARDHYQLPLALQEAGLLDLLLTDYYGHGGPMSKAGWINAERQAEALPASKVRGSLLASIAKKCTGRLIKDPELRNHLTDRLLEARIGRQAEARDAHIITYEPYAVHRPSGGFSRGRRQVVFYYHPHVDAEDTIYRADQKRFPQFYTQTRVTESPWRRRTANAWKHADLVLCASSFTKRSVVAAGLPEDKCLVVPYGAGQPEADVSGDEWLVTGRRRDVGYRRTEDGQQKPEVGDRSPGEKRLRLLFVGRNPLRKGLHHLLMAWDAARKGPGDLLTIVCAAKPAEVTRLAEGRGDVHWLDSVSAEKLAQFYAKADALIVPSLCEGFGHVYLEAMSHGCAVVGTKNSALPDIGSEEDGVFTLDAGDVEGLGKLLARASTDPDVFRSRRDAARKCAGEFTWSRFRKEVASVAKSVAG